MHRFCSSHLNADLASPPVFFVLSEYRLTCGTAIERMDEFPCRVQLRLHYAAESPHHPKDAAPGHPTLLPPNPPSLPQRYPCAVKGDSCEVVPRLSSHQRSCGAFRFNDYLLPTYPTSAPVHFGSIMAMTCCTVPTTTWSWLKMWRRCVVLCRDCILQSPCVCVLFLHYLQRGKNYFRYLFYLCSPCLSLFPPFWL